MDDEPAPSTSFLELASSPKKELAKKMLSGQKPDRSALAGFEYRGLNTAGWLRAAGADRFVKGFAGDRGYNRRVPRGPQTARWLPVTGLEPEAFAFFTVTDVSPEAVDNRYLQSLLIDYSPFAAGRLDIAGRLRDYLVAIDQDHTILLGHAFLAVGPRRMPATFFVLERLRPAP